jgi:hypothetical protein
MKIEISSSPLSTFFSGGNIPKRAFCRFRYGSLLLNISFFLFVISQFFISDTIAQNFFPLKIGNAYQIKNDWSWSVHHFADWGTDYINLTVQSDTIIEGNHYFTLNDKNNQYKIFNNVTLFSYDSLDQKLYVWIQNESRKRLAVDFNIPADSNFVSFIRETGIEFTSKGFSTKVIFGDTCVVYSMEHPHEDNIPYYIYEFANKIGLIKYKYWTVSTWSDDKSEQESIAAIVDSIKYNSLVLRVDSLYPVEDRQVDTFPFLLTILYTASHTELIDSFYLDVQHIRADTLVQKKKYNLSKSNPSHISLYLTGLLSGDKIKFRVSITDTSIFYNVAHYPDTGWVVMNVLSPILNVEIGKIPTDYKLAQNFPNPFNPTTTIRYQIPEPEFVIIRVFDVLGNEIATIVNEEKIAGSYEAKFDGSRLTSGIYYYKITAGEFSQTNKMVLIK